MLTLFRTATIGFSMCLLVLILPVQGEGFNYNNPPINNPPITTPITTPVGSIVMYGGAGDIARLGWMYCHGQMLEIYKYPELYSVIGTMYGGEDGKFALPDLRSRFIIGAGQPNELTHRNLTDTCGEESYIPANPSISSESNKLPAHFVLSYIIRYRH